MTITNEQFATQLRNLADKYTQDPQLPQVTLSRWAWSKEELIQMIKAFRGKWIKNMGDDNYVRYESEGLGLTLTIPRDKVCTRTVTWDCQPLLSPEEEGEVFQAAQGEPAPAVAAEVEDDVPF